MASCSCADARHHEKVYADLVAAWLRANERFDAARDAGLVALLDARGADLERVLQQQLDLLPRGCPLRVRSLTPSSHD